MTKLESLQRLSAATGHVLRPDERDVYLERLKPYADLAVTAACRKLETTSTFFPKLAEIIDAIHAAQKLLVSDDDPRSWRTCPHCDGSGWQIQQCDGRGQCGRGDKLRFEHGAAWGRCVTPHSYATRCQHAA